MPFSADIMARTRRRTLVTELNRKSLWTNIAVASAPRTWKSIIEKKCFAERGVAFLKFVLYGGASAKASTVIM